VYIIVFSVLPFGVINDNNNNNKTRRLASGLYSLICLVLPKHKTLADCCVQVALGRPLATSDVVCEPSDVRVYMYNVHMHYVCVSCMSMNNSQ